MRKILAITAIAAMLTIVEEAAAQTTYSASGSNTDTFRVRGTMKADNRIKLKTVFFLSGSGSPEGRVHAPAGSIYLRVPSVQDSTLYIKENTTTDSTGWRRK